MAALSRTLALPIGTLANPTLRLWVGKQVADEGCVVLGLLALAYASMALNVVTDYALHAFGRVRLISD